ncbi:MAG: NADP-dependent malic enzyme [Caldiserica bacterium]|nr:NADP-dependent malic enzyme [Caldisericota bacterium]MDH7561797.1 NADP-dependent malic enzyme [Caldisericota bacterium]
MKLKSDLSNLEECFPESFTPAQVAKAKTIFYKTLALEGHRFYGGKMQTIPKAGVFGFNWFNVWYTPGVSKISTTIRDDNERSFELSNRGNLVAVVSDSTRVLGDGDVTPPGGLGVMEGKAFLMKYLGGIDAVALCIDSRNQKGENDPEIIIDLVKRIQPSFGAVNLEDISQPNCYRVLDVLREECDIPVWHDDQQGTACVTLAGLLNALKIVGKKLSEVKIVYFGAGAANTTCLRLNVAAGADPEKSIMFDSRGALHKRRKDVEADPRFYRKWEICMKTNPEGVKTMEEAMKGADVLISVSTPGPGVIKPEWIKLMAPKSIVFVCANPVPEIYPYEAKEAGAYIVGTGRGDFPNQINNSLGFPGILKGALLVRARKVTDAMAIAAAKSLADFAEKRGINPDNIIATMEEPGVFPNEAADVAQQAVKDGVSRVQMTREEAYRKAKEDIDYSRNLTELLIKESFIKTIPPELLEKVLQKTIEEVSRS